MSHFVPSYKSLQKAARKALKDNFSAYEAAKMFGRDYHNVCAYYRGSKEIPLSMMFEILDYVGIQVVCFKRY